MRSATRTFLELAHNHLNPSYVPFPHCFLEALLWPLGLFLLISPRLLNTHRERNVNFFLKLLELWMLVVSAGFPQRLEVIVVVIWWYTNKIELKRKIELFSTYFSHSPQCPELSGNTHDLEWFVHHSLCLAAWICPSAWDSQCLRENIH